MENCKPVPTLKTHQIDLILLGTERFNSTTYRQAIWGLVRLLICTRLDIAFAVGQLSLFMKKPATSL